MVTIYPFDYAMSHISFSQIQNSPDTHRGKVVVVGGKILALDQQKNISRIEVLQLPLSEDYLPQNHPSARQERFLALCSGKNPLDPEFVRPETAITIVGEVMGSTTFTIDREEKEIPVFKIKDLTIWDTRRHEESMVEPRGWYYSPLYVPYGYHSYQWSNCGAFS